LFFPDDPAISFEMKNVLSKMCCLNKAIRPIIKDLLKDKDFKRLMAPPVNLTASIVGIINPRIDESTK